MNQEEMNRLLTTIKYNRPYELTVAEQDKQGTFYGYKVLIFNTKEECFHSPIYPYRWNRNGTLEADIIPSENNKTGIYFTKHEFDNNIYEYFTNIHRKNCYMRELNFDGALREIVKIVRCALSGTIIETERGFRTQYARITHVKGDLDGNWKSYQEARGSSRHFPYKEDETDYSYSRKPFNPDY